jgi:hypothetical protein
LSGFLIILLFFFPLFLKAEHTFEITGSRSFHPYSRFDSGLSQFSADVYPGTINSTDLDRLRGGQSIELGYNQRSGDQRFGIKFSHWEGDPFGLQNYTSGPFYTNLQFGMRSNSLRFQYEKIFKRTESWDFHYGAGAGLISTEWTANGWGVGEQWIPQEGRLVGTGLALRLELGSVHRITDRTSMGIGFFWDQYMTPSLSGTWNGDLSNIYLREDGRLTPIADTQIRDTILYTEQFTRKLDISLGLTGIYFSARQRIFD